MTVKLNVRRLAQEIVSSAIVEWLVLCQMVNYKISSELLNVSKTQIMFCRWKKWIYGNACLFIRRRRMYCQGSCSHSEHRRQFTWRHYPVDHFCTNNGQTCSNFHRSYWSKMDTKYCTANCFHGGPNCWVEDSSNYKVGRSAFWFLINQHATVPADLLFLHWFCFFLCLLSKINVLNSLFFSRILYVLFTFSCPWATLSRKKL